ncbi:MFS transporter [Luteipulveratus mongoliensis]|nr:MFS transporter [Luteipulveratus mongoliensis]
MERRVLAAISAVVLSYGLLQTMLVPAANHVQADLHTSSQGATWAVLSAMLLSSAAVTPVLGRLADRFGQRTILLACLWIYLAGALVAAVAPSIEVLIAARVLQGVGLTLVPLSFALVKSSLTGPAVGRGLALAATLVTGSAGAGLLAGGLIADHFSWRWLFVIGAAVIVVALVLTSRDLPADEARDASPIDWSGAALLAVALTTLLLAVTQGRAWGWTSWQVLGLVGLALLSAALLVVVEERVAAPLIDLNLMRGGLLAAHLGALMLGVNQFMLYTLLPHLAQAPGSGASGLGLSATAAAALLVPGALLTIPAGRWRPARVDEPRSLLAVGLAVSSVGAGVLLVARGGPLVVTAVYVLVSLGYGIAMAALPRLVARECPPLRLGSVNAVNTVARTVGGAFGSQLAALVLSGQSRPGRSAYDLGFAVAAAAAVIGVPLVLAAGVRQSRVAV